MARARAPIPLVSLLLLFLVVTETTALVCLRGSFLSGASCVLCPAGTFGHRAGLTSPACSGPCAPGHFCPPGSTSATEKRCGSSVYYCPRGSAERQRVSDGYYTVTFPLEGTTPSSVDRAAAQTACEPGHYCVHGVRRKCPAGSYGITAALSSAACSGACPRGFFCPEGTATPVPCPAGTYGAVVALERAACSGPCPIGHYCEAATVTPRSCPAGSFGASQGLRSKHCSSTCSGSTCVPSPCPAGFFCPLATTTPTECGDTSVFCPSGSAAPTPVTLGFYSIRTRANSSDQYLDGASLALVNQSTRSDKRPCERGTYCVSGVKRLCPAGTYGAAEALSTAQCSGPCPAGFFCPPGTSDFYLFPCTNRTSFCRQGSAQPTRVTTGFYTVTAPTGDIRVDQTVCPQGSYCVGGVKYLCPVGTFGATTGLSSSACSGRCQDGYTCAAGSVSATQTPCPTGQYSRNGVSCSPCLPGYWCAAGSPDPMQNPCGSDSTFCPLGSSAPTNVATGYFAVGQTVTTHSAQAMCLPQTVQHLPQCPSRTVGVNSGL